MRIIEKSYILRIIDRNNTLITIMHVKNYIKYWLVYLLKKWLIRWTIFNWIRYYLVFKGEIEINEYSKDQNRLVKIVT